MGITREKFLLRHVVFGKRDKEYGNYTVNYKGQYIGKIYEIGGQWVAYFEGRQERVATRNTRHNASEALLDAWIAEHGE